jgi:hypothetical protein
VFRNKYLTQQGFLQIAQSGVNSFFPVAKATAGTATQRLTVNLAPRRKRVEATRLDRQFTATPVQRPGHAAAASGGRNF